MVVDAEDGGRAKKQETLFKCRTIKKRRNRHGTKITNKGEDEEEEEEEGVGEGAGAAGAGAAGEEAEVATMK